MPGDTTGTMTEDDIQPARGSRHREQLASEFAAIERAIGYIAPGRAGLESWTNSAVSGDAKPRPVWLLIGVLWLSTALATISAVLRHFRACRLKRRKAAINSDPSCPRLSRASTS